MITPYYDSMIGKMIVHGPDRDTARRRLVAALDQVLIAGMRTNVGFQRWLLTQDPIVAGRVTTRFLDEAGATEQQRTDAHAALAAVVWITAHESSAVDMDVWRRMARRRFTPHTSPRSVVLVDLDGTITEAFVGGTRGRFWIDGGATFTDVSIQDGVLCWTIDDVTRAAPVHVDLRARTVAVSLRGDTETFDVADGLGPAKPGEGGASGAADAIRAPFPALVAEVHVKAGDVVHAGQVVVVLEAMKILHSLAATGDGIVASVRVAPGEQVASRDVLIDFEEA